MRVYSWEQYDPLEMTKLGATIAEFFGGQVALATGRDGHSISRFCRRCIVSGMVSRGAQVIDFRMVPSQALRYGIGRQKLEGAAYISYYNREVQVHVYDRTGKNLSADGALRIRELMNSEPELVSGISDIGSLIQYTNGIDDYVEHLLRLIERPVSGRWLVDAQSDPISLVVEQLFTKSGIEFNIFNPMLVGDGTLKGRDEFLSDLSSGKYAHGVVIERDELLGATYYSPGKESRHYQSFEELVKGVFSR